MIGAIIAKRKARSSFDCLNRRELHTFLRDWADDATFVYPGNLSVSGKMEGKAAIDDWFQKFMNWFPDVNFTVKNVCVENIFALGGTNVLAVEWDVALTNRDGKEFENNGVTVITLKKGKAVQVCDYIHLGETAKEAWGER